MAEAAGLLLSSLSLAGLVSAALDCFELVQAARHLGADYTLLETSFANQTFRLTAWADACGLFRPAGGHDPRLDEPVLRRRVEETLKCIALLLGDGNGLKSRYGLKPAPVSGSAGRSHGDGAAAQRWDPFAAFKERIRRTHKANVLSRPRWVVNDRRKFEELLQRYRGFIEDLESFTRQLDVSEVQMRTVVAEMDRMFDIQTLESIEAAHISAHDSISDAASVRLAILRAPTTLDMDAGPASNRSIFSDAETFFTAPSLSNRLEVDDSTELIHLTEDLTISDSIREPTENVSPGTNSFRRLDKRPIVPADLSLIGKQMARVLPIAEAWAKQVQVPRFSLKQYQLVGIRRDLASVQKQDAYFSYSLQPLGDCLGLLWAAIEGPQSTPYEGGIFHLSIDVRGGYPWMPPMVRFLTKIYHPNIDPQGRICCDMLGNRWSQVFSLHNVLVSLASLLDDPGIEDPYVPAIADEYIQNRAQFEANARLYTMRYAQEIVPSKDFIWETDREVANRIKTMR